MSPPDADHHLIRELRDALQELRAACHVRDFAKTMAERLGAADRYTEALINAGLSARKAEGR